MRNILFKWHKVVEDINVFNNIVNTLSLARKRRLLNKWLRILRRRHKLHQSYAYLVDWREKVLISMNFQAWHQRTLQIKRMQGRISKAIEFRRKFTLARSITGMKEWVSYSQTKEGFKLYVHGKLQHVLLKWVFRGWIMQTKLWSEKRALLSEAQHVYEHNLLVKTLCKLSNITKENLYLKSKVLDAFIKHSKDMKLERANSWHELRMVHSVIKAWYSYALTTTDLRRKANNVKLNSLKGIFRRWRDFFLHKKTLKTLGTHLSGAHRLFLLKDLWRRWQAMIEASLFQQQFAKFKALKAWMEYVKWKTFWRRMEEEAMVMLLNSLQRRVIWAWYRLVSGISARREEHQQQRILQREAMVIATRTERRQKTELLATVFSSWKSRTQLGINVSAFINKRHLHIMELSWASWLILLEQIHQAKELRRVWVQSLLRRAMRAWRHSTQKSIAQVTIREEKASEYASWKRMQVAWLTWRTHSDFFRERVKALDQCLQQVQAKHAWDTVREILNRWKWYTDERVKKRENLWAAEAAFKKHKVADYLTAWHHYTLASKASASTLRGSIQSYRPGSCSPIQRSQSSSPLRGVSGSPVGSPAGSHSPDRYACRYWQSYSQSGFRADPVENFNNLHLPLSGDLKIEEVTALPDGNSSSPCLFLPYRDTYQQSSHSQQQPELNAIVEDRSDSSRSTDRNDQSEDENRQLLYRENKIKQFEREKERFDNEPRKFEDESEQFEQETAKFGSAQRLEIKDLHVRANPRCKRAFYRDENLSDSSMPSWNLCSFKDINLDEAENGENWEQKHTGDGPYLAWIG